MPTTEDKLAGRRQAALATPSDLGSEAVKNISGALNALLADVFALYVKTKNFHWHMSGPHFRDYHLLFDEQAGQIFAMTDDIAERVRKLGGDTVRSIGQIGRLQRLSDNDAEYVDPLDMIAELREDNRAMLASMRQAHDLCGEEKDVATASVLEVWIDETERRIWFLFAKKIGPLMDWAIHGVKIVHSNELDLNTPQTSGMTRAAAITHARAGASKLWAGTMLVQPDARTGPHHHGELETVLYVLKGRVRMRWGDQLQFSEEAGSGDFIYVPPYVPHQEINASPDETCEAVVVRDGQDPIVVNLDLRTPEPASAGRGGMPFHPDR